ncbi:hypothetical protein BEWA_026140 [Theileria equi strain WA]|uniref:Uncharacterized protein n=1 Tax=Theileria equi strain WA TaxID=1537102 RepID=L0AW39_THEEQ|nr:hypothetical protein BEWA_026140 [Theileria equi strain WA]AFZ79765.1 hypothetical protein BEWA_026140 [Theileria equi strain WA]|eukprot:XP_004829431.1 hypothetical protein BEWA_026140 [Theileria equi strain WA]
MSQEKQVCIDTGKTDAGGRYRDQCGNTITVKKVESPSGLNGYKRYTHTLTVGHSVGGIYHNGVQQSGIDVSGGGYYEKNVTVYYLGYDESNLVPLIVGLAKTWLPNEYYYYKRRYPLETTSQWNQEDYDVKQESDLSTKLPEIIKDLNTVVVLNLSQTQGRSYYANGDISPPQANLTFQIEVTGPSTEYAIYRKYTHKPSGGIDAMRLISTKTAFTNIPFEDPRIYTTECTLAYVYYWSLDGGHTSPLLLELTSSDKSSIYYTLSDGKRWIKQNGIRQRWKNTDLQSVLDRENCGKNGAHQIDISRKSNLAFRNTSYYCPCCDYKQIGLSTHGTDYSYYFHNLYRGFFSRFKNGRTEQSGITFPGIISNVYVYWYPKGSEGIPILINIQGSSHWFERTSIDSSTWRPVSNNKPNNTFDKRKILELLKDILPTVTIDIGKISISTGGESGTYRDPSGGGGNETIQFKKQKIGSDYVSLTNSVETKGGFIVNLQHNGSPLPGVKPNLVVKNVTAYYSGTGLSPDNLLTVGFETRGTGSRKNYVYYSRETKTSIWKPDLQKNTKSGAPPSTTQLREIKEKLESEQSQKSKDSGSNVGTIVGGVFGSLTSGTAVGLGIWKGTALLSALKTLL